MTDPGTPGEDQWFVLHTAQNVLCNLHLLQLASSGTVVSATGLGEMGESRVSSCRQFTKRGVMVRKQTDFPLPSRASPHNLCPASWSTAYLEPRPQPSCHGCDGQHPAHSLTCAGWSELAAMCTRKVTQTNSMFRREKKNGECFWVFQQEFLGLSK